MNDDERFVKRLVTHTYTAPSGAVIVVTNVPAEIYVAADGTEQTNYSMDVAEHLAELIQIAMATAEASTPSLFSFDQKPTLPDADFQVDFKAPDAVFSNASLQTWRRIMDKAYNSYKLAMRSIDHPTKVFPTIAYMAPGSIVLGIRTGEKRSLFDLNVEQSEPPEKAMRLLLATSTWLTEGGEPPAEIGKDDAAIETMLRAVEELSPLSKETQVYLSRVGTDERTEFTYKTRAAAKQRRIELRLKNSEARRHELTGIISKLEDSGEVTLRDVVSTPVWKSKTARCSFNVEDLLSTLLENFGKKVKISAIEEKVAGQWTRHPELLDVERFQVSEGDVQMVDSQSDPERRVP